MREVNRILFICRRFCPGEAWTNRLLAYAKGFSEQGVKTSMLFLITDENRTPYSIDIPGVDVLNLWEDDGYVAKIHRGISFLKNRRRIRHFIHDGDLCFMMDASGFYLNEVKASRKDVRIVYEVTEHPLVMAQHNRIRVQLLLNRLKRIDYLFVISASLKRFFIQNGIPKNKIEVINMFVDASRFEGLQRTTTNKYIAYCGTVSYDKDGVHILIESFAAFHKRYPDYSLEIYGRGVGNSIKELIKLTEEMGIADSVVFTGKVSSSQIPQLLVNASILALSRPNNLQNQYGFPTKLGEYLMSGNPVVVTSVGEIPLFISDGYSGYLAQPDSVDSFVSKLFQAADDLSKGIEVAKRGKEIAMTEFSSLMQTKKALDFISNH